MFEDVFMSSNVSKQKRTGFFGQEKPHYQSDMLKDDS